MCMCVQQGAQFSVLEYDFESTVVISVSRSVLCYDIPYDGQKAETCSIDY